MGLAATFYRDGEKGALGVFCNNGRHRSVVVAEDAASMLRDRGFTVKVYHRDVHTAPRPRTEAAHVAAMRAIADEALYMAGPVYANPEVEASVSPREALGLMQASSNVVFAAADSIIDSAAVNTVSLLACTRPSASLSDTEASTSGLAYTRPAM